MKDEKGPIDHVKKNIQLTAKINKIRDIQLFCRNISRENDTEEIKKFRDESDIIKRFTKVQKMNKWNDFKSKKQYVIEGYTNRLKIMYLVKCLITLFNKHRYVT